MIEPVEHTQHISIRAIGEDEVGHIYVWVLMSTGRRRLHAAVPLHGVAKPTDTIVNELRLVSHAARTEFQRRVQACALEPTTFQVKTMPGWHGERFVFPDGTLLDPTDRDPFVRLPDAYAKFAAKFEASGDIAAWYRILRLARGNTRLMLAIGLAFTGPIVDWLGLEAPAIQLTDRRTGVGKSSIAEVAGAVWGGHENGRYAEGWIHTPNYIELCARACHAALLVLDDLRTFKFSTYGFAGFDELLMGFANGNARGRLTDVAAASRFRTPLLSTSNAHVIATAAAHHVVADDALLVRLIDVPLPHGHDSAFETLHGRASHVDFSTELRRLAGRARGRPAEHFIRRLERMRETNDAKAARFVRNERERCRRHLGHRLSTSGRDLSRFYERFATIYSAMAAAIHVGTIDWTPQEALDAVLACADAHVELVACARSSVEPEPLVDSLEALRRYVADNRDRFTDAQARIDDRAHDHNACPGYFAVHDGQPEYFFAEAQWRRICGSGAANAKEMLRRRGMLNATNARPGTRRVLRISGEAVRVQVIAVKAAFFEENAVRGPKGDERAIG